MTVIEIPDAPTALKARAAAQSRALEAWPGKLAGEEIGENRRDRFRALAEDFE